MDENGTAAVQERLQEEAEEQKKDPVMRDMFGGDGDGNE